MIAWHRKPRVFDRLGMFVTPVEMKQKSGQHSSRKHQPPTGYTADIPLLANQKATDVKPKRPPLHRLHRRYSVWKNLIRDVLSFTTSTIGTDCTRNRFYRSIKSREVSYLRDGIPESARRFRHVPVILPTRMSEPETAEFFAAVETRTFDLFFVGYFNHAVITTFVTEPVQIHAD